jgi:SAM-dependent methyltransferase
MPQPAPTEEPSGPPTDTVQAHGRRPVTPDEWDRRYAERDRIWSGAPNGTLVVEASALPAGRALDVGCGEGADALWLAEQGWQVTAVDVSRVALARAATAAAAAGVEVRWLVADIADGPPAGEVFDLVSAQYLALRHTADDAGIRGLMAAVAPGGTLLVVGHGEPAGHETRETCETRDHGGPGHDGWVQPSDVADRLGDGWSIEVHETRLRPSAPLGARHSDDVVLRARRTA